MLSRFLKILRWELFRSWKVSQLSILSMRFLGLFNEKTHMDLLCGDCLSILSMRFTSWGRKDLPDKLWISFQSSLWDSQRKSKKFWRLSLLTFNPLYEIQYDEEERFQAQRGGLSILSMRFVNNYPCVPWVVKSYFQYSLWDSTFIGTFVWSNRGVLSILSMRFRF